MTGLPFMLKFTFCTGFQNVSVGKLNHQALFPSKPRRPLGNIWERCREVPKGWKLANLKELEGKVSEG